MDGLRVNEVLDLSGNAAKAGIMVDDILLRVNEENLLSVDHLISIMKNLEGGTCELQILRKGELKELEVISGALGLSLTLVDVTLECERHITKAKLNAIQMTTAPNIEGNKVLKTVSIVGSECAFGMNIIKDVLSAVTDVTGGRSGVIQKTLRDARNQCLEDLKREAYQVGANAVIAVNLDYSEFSGGGRAMLFVAATGTAVIVEECN